MFRLSDSFCDHVIEDLITLGRKVVSRQISFDPTRRNTADDDPSGRQETGESGRQLEERQPLKRDTAALQVD